MGGFVTCRFFDGRYWEAPVPDEWTCREETGLRSASHVLESGAGSRLVVWTGGYGPVAGRKWDDVPEEITVDEHRSAFSSVLDEARTYRMATLKEQGTAAMRAALGREPSISQHRLGELIGFTYERRTQEGVGWAGRFCAQSLVLRVAFCAPPNSLTRDSTVAHSFLSTVRTYAPNPTVETDVRKSGARDSP